MLSIIKTKDNISKSRILKREKKCILYKSKSWYTIILLKLRNGVHYASRFRI